MGDRWSYLTTTKQKENGTNPQPEHFSPFLLPFLHNLYPIAGAILGGIVAATGIVGFVGAIAPIKRKDCLIAFIVLLIAVILAELGLGGVIWFKTLRMRSTFQDQWTHNWTPSIKIAFQDMVRPIAWILLCSLVSIYFCVALKFDFLTNNLVFPSSHSRSPLFFKQL
jgi:hypothetical protein